MTQTVQSSLQTVTCSTCFYHCILGPEQTGQCRARYNHGGEILPLNYGQLTALALDPVEKKPLKMFYPGSMILSAGSYGCNLHCPFCQNAEISQAGRELQTEYMSPRELAGRAQSLSIKGNIGVAYTYNEPLVCWEYVRDTAKIVHDLGMKNVVVTNGSVCEPVLEKILPYIDAMNIDLKGFTPEWYRYLGGDLETVKKAVTVCAVRCHVELTTLIVPGWNDGDDEMKLLAQWVASVDAGIPLHITRFFPRYHMSGLEPTPVESVYRLASAARRYLANVFTGNC
ncbi:MAG: AmmeMemoRadiSam system radical SAM enzyme [Treponema sp.]|nr:AmmeMemoRadiSam system radical SAM enzyme [Treponema sp.]